MKNGWLIVFREVLKCVNGRSLLPTDTERIMKESDRKGLDSKRNQKHVVHRSSRAQVREGLRSTRFYNEHVLADLRGVYWGVCVYGKL